VRSKSGRLPRHPQRPHHAHGDHVRGRPIDDPPPTGVVVIDPVAQVACQSANPLVSISYQHDGDMQFLLGVVDPKNMARYRNRGVRYPRGVTATPRPANLTIELETLVRSLRDAEVLVVGTLQRACVINRVDVF
jgi:hypothetical protein